MIYPPVILASSSPRRARLLRQVGVPFEAIPSGLEEVVDEELPPHEIATSLALQKAKAVAGDMDMTNGSRAVIGADTIVVFEGEILGKPGSTAEAAGMLKRLSGTSHDVITGVAVVWIDTDGRKASEETFHATTTVYFRTLEEREIEAYVTTGRPLDKAGGYGIQEQAAAFVEAIRGCYFNVVGLPVSLLCERLKKSP